MLHPHFRIDVVSNETGSALALALLALLWSCVWIFRTFSSIKIARMAFEVESSRTCKRTQTTTNNASPPRSGIGGANNCIVRGSFVVCGLWSCFLSQGPLRPTKNKITLFYGRSSDIRLHKPFLPLSLNIETYESEFAGEIEELQELLLLVYYYCYLIGWGSFVLAEALRLLLAATRSYSQYYY